MSRPLAWSKNYWRHGFSIGKTIDALLASFGVLWLAFEATAFFFDDAAASWLRSQWLPFLVAGVLYALWKAKPTLRVCYRLSGRDTKIEVRVADILDVPGALVVSTNSTFETDDKVISSQSLQGQFTALHYSSHEHLAADLAKELAEEPSQSVTRRGRRLRRYPLGTTAKVEVNGRTAYFIALAHLNEHGNAESSFEHLKECLPALWEFIGSRGHLGPVLVPVLGSGRARLPEPRELIIREIIKSFAAACASRRFCDHLIVVVSPKDFDDHDVNITELGNFVRHTCLYTEFKDEALSRVGTGIA